MGPQAHSGGQPKFDRTTGHRQRILRIAERSRGTGVHVHAEGRMTGQHLQFLVQNLQALLRDGIGLCVIDADLQVLQSGTFRRSIRSTVKRYPFVIMPAIMPRRRMWRMMSSRSGCKSGSPPLMVDDGSAELGKAVDPPNISRSEPDGGNVELVAVGTGEITAASRDDLGEHRMPGRLLPPRDHPRFAPFSVRGRQHRGVLRQPVM